jgi:hypothetical protein
MKDTIRVEIKMIVVVVIRNIFDSIPSAEIAMIVFIFGKNPSKGGIPISEKITIIVFISVELEFNIFILNFFSISIILIVTMK